jgi:hypothetical protein
MKKKKKKKNKQTNKQSRFSPKRHFIQSQNDMFIICKRKNYHTCLCTSKQAHNNKPLDGAGTRKGGDEAPWLVREDDEKEKGQKLHKE